MPDTELLTILKIMSDVVGQEDSRKFNSQAVEPSIIQSCKINTDIEGRSGNVNVTDSNSNMPAYFRPSTSRQADKKASELIKTNYTVTVVMFFHELSVSRAHSNCR